MRRLLAMAAAGGLILAAAGAFAAPGPEMIVGEPTAAGATTLRFDDVTVQLWGVTPPEPGHRCVIDREIRDCAAQGLEDLQTELEPGTEVRCEVVSRSGGVATGKCFRVRQECYGTTCNEALDDLAALQVERGLAVQRPEIAKGAYDEAEDLARYGLEGVWGEPHGGGVLPAAAVAEPGFTGSLTDMSMVTRLLRTWCAMGAPGPLHEQYGTANLREAGIAFAPANPGLRVEHGGVTYILRDAPTDQTCSIRALSSAISREETRTWVKTLDLPFREAGTRGHEAERGVEHFVYASGFGRQTLIVKRLGGEVEFILTRAL